MKRVLTSCVAWLLMVVSSAAEELPVARKLYVAAPGLRNYLEWGGAGILVFDIDRDHQFVKRIPVVGHSDVDKPSNVKGVVASAVTQRIYFTTLQRLWCVDLLSEQKLWDKELPGGCDRLALTPDGGTLYVPSLEGPHWNVVDAATGDVRKSIVTNSGAHNTVAGLDGKSVYLAGLKSPLLRIVDTMRQEVVGECGPFSAAVRPFTVDAAQSRVFVNVNDRLGFEVGDLKTGKVLHTVDVPGYKKGLVKRHGCPCHGIGLTPDASEVWLCDGHNQCLHVFDNRLSPPKYLQTIKLFDDPGWVTFSLDGRFAYPSTLEVIDTRTRRVVAALQDEQDRRVQSEKVVELQWRAGRVIRAGDQFGLGR